MTRTKSVTSGFKFKLLITSVVLWNCCQQGALTGVKVPGSASWFIHQRGFDLVLWVRVQFKLVCKCPLVHKCVVEDWTYSSYSDRVPCLWEDYVINKKDWFYRERQAVSKESLKLGIKYTVLRSKFQHWFFSVLKGLFNTFWHLTQPNK